MGWGGQVALGSPAESRSLVLLWGPWQMGQSLAGGEEDLEGGSRIWFSHLISGHMASLSPISDTLATVIGKPLTWPG